MSEFIVAAAQCGSVKGEIDVNLDNHERIVHIAAQHGVDLLLFPELSLTGYEPELARDLQLHCTDKRLERLTVLASQYVMTIVFGAPLTSEMSKPYIASFVARPGRPVKHYLKQHLHDGESDYFVPGSGESIVHVGNVGVGLAICADTTHPSHARQAARNGATVYAASVLISESGY